MAAQFRLEEMEKEGKRTFQLLYHNRKEQYVPVPRGYNEIIRIIQHYHDQPCAGHYTAEMTFRRVYCTYYWPTIRIDIWSYVRSCDSCQWAQDLTEYPVEPLRPIICLKPFEIVYVDYVGPYMTAGTGRKGFSLFVIDTFIGWLQVYLTAVATSSATITSLKGYCKRFGFPQVLHSD